MNLDRGPHSAVISVTLTEDQIEEARRLRPFKFEKTKKKIAVRNDRQEVMSEIAASFELLVRGKRLIGIESKKEGNADYDPEIPLRSGRSPGASTISPQVGDLPEQCRQHTAAVLWGVWNPCS